MEDGRSEGCCLDSSRGGGSRPHRRNRTARTNIPILGTVGGISSQSRSDRTKTIFRLCPRSQREKKCQAVARGALLPIQDHYQPGPSEGCWEKRSHSARLVKKGQ